MKRYRTNCKEECNNLKKRYCLFRITRNQQRLIAKIRKIEHCKICGRETVKARYKNKWINLCTHCGVRRKIEEEAI